MSCAITNICGECANILTNHCVAAIHRRATRNNHHSSTSSSTSNLHRKCTNNNKPRLQGDKEVEVEAVDALKLALRPCVVALFVKRDARQVVLAHDAIWDFR